MTMTTNLPIFGSRQVKKIHPESVPWVEKYRPRTVEEVVFQDEVVRTLRKSIETGNLPHLLFYGPPGTGKTSTILAIAHQLYGPVEVKNRVLELNASDERGINVVRTKVKSFSQLAVSKDPSGDFPCPPYKIIILDEADLMTNDAQNALRRIMENHSKVTRFCMICNYVSRIIEPLTSRCAKFRFKPLGQENAAERLAFIASEEKINISKDVLSDIAKYSGGDMRKAITWLQSAHRLYGDEIDPESVLVIAGVVPEKEVAEVLESCRSNVFSRLQMHVNKIVMSGYSASQFLEQFHDLIVTDQFLTDVQKAKIIQVIAESDRYLLDGADEFLQILNVCAFTMKTLCAGQITT